MDDARAKVGAGLRRIREARGLSLSELGRLSGVAKATLSTLESGEANPTLDTLNALSGALHVSLGDLLAPSAAPVAVVRSSEGAPLQGSAVSARLVDQFDVDHGHLEFAMGTVGEKGQESPAHGPGVIEHVFVTQGRARVGPLADPVELDEGDYLRMEASEPHLYQGVGGPARLLILMRYPRR